LANETNVSFEIMSTKNFIRIIVVAALLAWPGVETYRWWVARQQLTASVALQERVAVKLAQMKNAPAKVSGQPTPVTAPTPAQPSSPSSLQ
jgi:hypothetical protein